MNYKWELKVDLKSCAGKKVLVAGGTGFIGRHFVSFLERNQIDTYVLTRQYRENTKYITYLNIDLHDKDRLNDVGEKIKFDKLIYLAANIPLANAKKETYQDAVDSTLIPFVNFCTAFVKEGSKLIYASSVDVLGNYSEEQYSEEAQPGVATPYGLAKYCGEFYAKDICAKTGAECLMYRFAQVYGPKEPIVRIIPILKNAILTNTKFEIWTDGTEKRRFLYVDDAVQSLVLGMTSDATGIYNIAGEEVITMVELVQLMESVFKKKLNYKILHKVPGVDNVPGIQKAKHDLLFQPEVSMQQGMEKVKEGENCE